MATYADILRAQNQAQLAGKQADIFAQLAQNAGPAVTPAGQVQGMQGMTSPTPQYVNYGAILQSGIGNFLAMKKAREAQESGNQAHELNAQFMQEAVGNDPQAQKLLGLAQAGLPGAAERLTDYIQPKKQATAAFLQAAGSLDPESAAYIAPQFGISPEFGARIARSFYNRAIQAAQMKQDYTLDKEAFKAALPKQSVPTDPNKVVPGFGGLTQGELLSMSPEQRAQVYSGAAWAGKQTQQEKDMSKAGAAAMADLQPTQQAIDMADGAIEAAGKAAFWPGQGGLMGPIANKALANNPANADLRNKLSQMTFAAAGGKLGGQVSDADVKLIQNAIALLDEGDRAGVIKQLNEFKTRMAQKHQGLQIKIQNAGLAPATTPKGGYPSFDEIMQGIESGQ